ncbi:MAG: hypothetical protein KAS32_21300, partial [Candidatus Peribacteraceae bacterium]|nr:hypothetical protein [Candidatus Peribacteraceae bacterium]
KLLDYVRTKNELIYSTVVFDPDAGTMGDSRFNTWRGWKAQVPDDGIDLTVIQPMLNLIHDVLADGDDDMYTYVLQWFKTMLKYPGGRTNIILLLCSDQGVGKGILTDFIIDYVCGSRLTLTASKLSDVCGQFNSIIAGKKFCVLNELSTVKTEWRGLMDKMKALITDKSCIIESKGIDKYPTKNYTNWMICTNNAQSVYLDRSDRRFCVLHPNEKHIGNTAYFKNIVDVCYNQYSGDMFLKFLLSLPDFELSPPPMTGAKMDLIELSKSSGDRFCDIQVRYDGKMVDVTSSRLYRKYRDWCDLEGEKPIANNHFGRYASKAFKKRILHGMSIYTVPTNVHNHQNERMES